MPFEETGICSDGHTISGFPSAWGWRERESKHRGETEILLNNCQWGKYSVVLALTGTHNSRSPYLLSSSVMGFHQAQHKNCTPAASCLEAQPLSWDTKQKCCLLVVRNGPQALMHAWISVKLHVLASFSWLYTCTRVITSLQLKHCACHTCTAVSTSLCSSVQASLHPLLLLCRLSSISFLVRPMVLRSFPPITPAAV